MKRPAAQISGDAAAPQGDEALAWEIGLELAPLSAPVLLRDRVAQGIGVGSRFELEPDRRQNPSWPEVLPCPRLDFPLVCRVKHSSAAVCHRELGKSACALLDTRLRRHGAVLLKGLPISDAQGFSEFVAGLGWPTVDKHGVSERARYADNVFGASDDVPDEFCLAPHNEQAYYGPDSLPTYPRRILFCSLTPAKQGGETPIARNREVLGTVRPVVIERLRAGVIYEQLMPSGSRQDPMIQNLGGKQPWQKAFGVESKPEVEKLVAEQGCLATWGPADELCVQRHGAAFVPSSQPEVDGVKDLWLNQVHNFYSFTPKYASSQSAIEDEVLSHLTAEYWRHSVAFTWQKGDVLCIDNEVCTHARMSFEGPRKHCAAFCM